MNSKALRLLEYNRIIERLMDYAASPMTREVISQMMPETKPSKVRDMLAETSEAVEVIRIKGNIPMGAFYDIAGHVSLARKGGMLLMKHLLEVDYNLQTARKVRDYLKDSELPALPILQAIREVIAVHQELESEIERCIITEDEMSDNASPELRSIRRAIIRQNDAIRNRLEHIVSASSNRLMLQDAIVTIRDGRYVIPVKAEYRSKFPGIIHDQSSSGSTLFIEPQTIVNMNNQLKEYYLQERAEMDRILMELSGRVSEFYHDLMNNQGLLQQLDFIFAKGRLSMSYHGEEPQINEEGYLELREARHPLIDPAKVVPIDVSIGRGYRTLVITGPNTGGKTVTLKTMGLLAMMTQSGLHIPAASTGQMPVFDNIYADIGDEQSIEQSLSTFSSHMNNIIDIVGNADGDTLVLFDELCAGTDPTEGAALAIALLDELRSRGCLTAATTHYTELKKYALSTEGVENASMEFDVETLSPTYHLSIGVPGKSNAFEISRKLGLSGHIIDEASRLLTGDDLKFENVVASLEEDRKKAQAERDAAVALNVQMKKEKEELDRELKAREKEADKVLADAREEARRIIKDSKALAKDIQKELKDLNKIDSLGLRNKAFNETREKLRKAEGEYSEKMVAEVNNDPVPLSKLKVGDRVKIISWDQTGEILSLPDSERDDIMVQMGIAKVTVKLSDIMLIEKARKGSGSKAKAQPTESWRKTGKGKGSSSYGNLMRQKAQTISPQTDVRGQNLEDAMMMVEKYLDDALMAGLSEVKIIHGRGTGVLQKGIRQMLKKHKHVKAYARGEYNDGGDGVTVVQLK